MIDSDLSVKELCRGMGFSEITHYNCKKKYQGMEVSGVRKLKSLEEENARLKRLVANKALDIEIFKEITSQKR